jgi:hypothetical protein
VIADGGEQPDLVALAQLVDAVERAAVGGAVPGDADVADLAGQGGVRVVAGAGAQGGGGGPGDDEGLDVEGRHHDLGQR